MNGSNPDEALMTREFAPSQPRNPAEKASAARLRGRPVMMSPNVVIERIRQLARSESGLYRIHHAHSGLYARARRQFGSWAGAVQAAGLDYSAALTVARRRSIETRRKVRRQRAQSARPHPDA